MIIIFMSSATKSLERSGTPETQRTRRVLREGAEAKRSGISYELGGHFIPGAQWSGTTRTSEVPSARRRWLSLSMTSRRRSSVLGHDIIPHSFHLNERRTVRSPLCEALFELGVGDSNAQPTDKVPFRGFEVRKTNDRFLLKRRRPRGDSNAQPTDSKKWLRLYNPYIWG